jgi:hypothetical protein
MKMECTKCNFFSFNDIFDRLREKMLNFAEQYEIREKHFETQAKAKDLEVQLHGAKLKQQAEIAAQESLRVKIYF